MSKYRTIVADPLACRIGWGVSDAWLERKTAILSTASEMADEKDDKSGHAAIAMLIAALYVGPNVLRIAAALSFDVGFVAKCASRLWEADVWLRDAMFYPWLDQPDDLMFIGCILDSLVATGDVEKVGADQYRLSEVSP